MFTIHLTRPTENEKVQDVKRERQSELGIFLCREQRIFFFNESDKRPTNKLIRFEVNFHASFVSFLFLFSIQLETYAFEVVTFRQRLQK